MAFSCEVYFILRDRMMHGCNRRDGFTLLEILLVVAAIAILAGIVIVAINPVRQLGETRDAQRRSDINALSSAIAQYYIKQGSYPSSINIASDCNVAYDTAEVGICATGESCAGLTLSNDLVPDYISSIPMDPIQGGNNSFSGYTVANVGNNRIKVCAPSAETATIAVTR